MFKKRITDIDKRLLVNNASIKSVFDDINQNISITSKKDKIRVIARRIINVTQFPILKTYMMACDVKKCKIDGIKVEEEDMRNLNKIIPIHPTNQMVYFENVIVELIKKDFDKAYNSLELATFKLNEEHGIEYLSFNQITLYHHFLELIIYLIESDNCTKSIVTKTEE